MCVCGGGLLRQGEGVIKAKPEAVIELCSSLEQRPNWDTFFEAGKVVQVLEEPDKVFLSSPHSRPHMTCPNTTTPPNTTQLVIGHGWTKGGMGVWPRDFALLLGHRPLTPEEGGAGHVLYAHSVDGVVEEDTSRLD